MTQIVSKISNTYTRKKARLSQMHPICHMDEHGDTVTCRTRPYGYTILSTTTTPLTSHKATRFPDSWAATRGSWRLPLGWDIFIAVLPVAYA